MRRKKEYQGINAYLKGERLEYPTTIHGDFIFVVPVQLYKILFELEVEERNPKKSPAIEAYLKKKEGDEKRGEI